MCGRFLLTAPGRIVAELFQLNHEPLLEPRFNIAPSQPVAVVRIKAESGARELDMIRWGLIPFWAKDPRIGHKMINARSETVAQKPAFRAAFNQRRCLIAADGFYEWKRHGRGKLPYLIRMKDESPFAFAGLWEHWRSPDDRVLESCTILTTYPNPLLKPLHERMPVILAAGDYDLWLDTSVKAADKLNPLLRPYPDDEMTAFPVSPAVNKPSHDSPDCILPVEPRE